MGPSGAGKSTMLHIVGMHDSSWTGEYYFLDQPIHRMKKRNVPSSTRNISGSYFRAIICSIL